MKIGIIGLGSIGRRHVRCLIDLGYKEIVALRTRKGVLKSQPEDIAPYVTEVYNWESFVESQPIGVIVANPTSLHISTLEQLKATNIPTLVEKPLSTDIAELSNLEEKYSNFDNVLVAYCMRFHAVTKAVKTFIDEGKLGKVYKGRLYFGYYLPKWHPDTDYRLEYMSRKDLGGGVLRTLAHEIDLVQRFLGNIKSTNGYVGHTSHLELQDVDDTVFMNCYLKEGGVIQVELDYLSPNYTREGYIIGEKGKLTYSFNKNEVTFIPFEGEAITLLSLDQYDINDMYRQQMQDFVDWTNGAKSKNCTYQEGRRVNELIEELEANAS
jgi:predicted dehydrogenase